jgi:hypothetical protein
MWKKLKKLLTLISLVDNQTEALKTLIENFEESFEDGKLTLEEAIQLLLQITYILRKLFPGLRK